MASTSEGNLVAVLSGHFTRGPKGEWAFRSDLGALHLISSGDRVRVLHRDGNLIYAGHVGLDGKDPLDVPIQLWTRWFDLSYRGEYLPRG